MPGTSSAYTFCDVVAKLDDEIGNQINVSSTGNKIEAELANTTSDFYTFGSGDWPQVLQCGKTAKIKFTGVASTGVNELRDMVEGWYFGGPYARTFQFDTPDTGAGSVRYEGDMRLEGFKFSGEAGKADPVMYEIDLKPDGPFKRMRLT